MSSRPLLASAGPTEDERAAELASLRRRVERLESDLADARLEIQRERNRSASVARAVGAVRNQLEPMYRALCALFGDLDATGATSPTVGAEPVPPRVTAAWEQWKRKLGGKQAEFIDALLEHGALTSTQLSVVAHCHPSNVSKIIYKLNRAGLISKNGNKFSLKEL